MNKEQAEPVLVVDKPAIVGEGSLWDAQSKVLYWVDILSHELYIYDPVSGENRTVLTCQSIGTVVPRARGGVAVALHNGFATIDLTTDKITPLVDPERTVPANRFNDGKCDPAGRFWAGTMEFNGEANRGALYCLETDHSVKKKVEPVTISNGIVWTADHKTMYYVDTGLNSVRAYDYDIDSGDIANERVVIENEGDGHFDGMSIDVEGMLWIALFGGAGVKRYDPNLGALLRDIGLPMSQVTSCAFGGENLDELYITSAAINLDEAAMAEQPLAGSLVKIDPGVQGVEAYAYGG
jgi:sugar lactone lactonase YvrE